MIKNSEDEIRDIIQEAQIYTVFQPIISLRDSTILGYEALSRGPVGSIFHNPSVMFSAAEEHNCLWELELLCRTTALKTVYKNRSNIRLFLNVNPNVMNDVKFIDGFTKEYLKNFSISPENIIFEITEKNVVDNYKNFINTINHYKQQEYRIAVDDAGAGYSGLNLISDIHPHFLKLDMNLIRDIDKDTIKQAIVKSMCEFSKLSNTQLIAEGIETQSEMEVLIDIGVHYGQGFFIQKPNEQLLPISDEIVHNIHSLNRKKNNTYGYKISNIHIGNISENTVTISPTMTVTQIDDLMQRNINYHGFCITKDNVVLGVITKTMLKECLSGLYGYSLNAHKPISSIMNTSFLSVDYRTPIDVVAKLAMSRNESSLYDFITITKDNEYYGMVTVKRLIEKTIEIEVVNAKHLNPLTELPGNIIIEQCLEKYINGYEQFTILYFDIDNFKAYNDVYGFESGDKIIKALASDISRHVTSNNFVGHIGGDDFIAVVNGYDVELICENVIQEFDQISNQSYSERDIRNGYIVSKNRHGIEETFPLLSLSIAAINNKNKKYESIYACSEEASKIKKKCKLIAGSAYFIAE